MKKLIVSFALLVGIVGMAQAGGRQGQGWNVTIVTGTAMTVFEGRGYLKKIILSSGTQSLNLDFLQAYSTAPNVFNGAGAGLIPNHLFAATAAVTPALVFLTTATPVNGNFNLQWSVGECDDCYVEIPGDSTPGTGGRVGGGLHIRKSVEASGFADQAAVYWSR